VTADVLEPASLDDAKPFPVPDGARLAFEIINFTTDGWQRGSVLVVFGDGRPSQLVAPNIPASGGPRVVKALGDWAKIFPEPIPILRRSNAARSHPRLVNDL